MPLRRRAPVHGGGRRVDPHTAAPSAAASSGIGVKERLALDSQDLFDAAMAGDARRVKWSLEAHADPNAVTASVRVRPLHICALQGHVKAARLLIEYEADLAATDTKLGCTPLSAAALAGHREMAGLLISAGAPLDGPEADGAAPLLHAATKNFADVAELLISAGADVNVARRASADPVRVREELDYRNLDGDWQSVLRGTGRALLDPLKVEGVTPLHVAAWHGSARICAGLLQAGARPASVDLLLRAPLMFAADRGHAEATTLLLERKAAVGANNDGHTAATLAARSGHAAIVRLLLELGGIDANFVAWAGGPTMLHVAAFHGKGGCATLLCEHDADVAAALDPGGLCPLMLAAQQGHVDICRELLGRGAAVNEVDDEGRSAWAHAAGAGRFEVCHLLAGFGASEQVLPRRRSRPATLFAPEAPPAFIAAARRRSRVSRCVEDVRPMVSAAIIESPAASQLHSAMSHHVAFRHRGEDRAAGL